MWRHVLARAHPDQGGNHELFVWLTSVREHLLGGAGQGPSGARRAGERPHGYEAGWDRPAGRGSFGETSGGPTPERIPFETAASFSELTARALALAESVGEPFGAVLALLGDCLEAPPSETVLYRQQQRGCSYKQLAAIAYRVGMSKQQRVQLYRIAERVPLATRHAGHILGRLSK